MFRAIIIGICMMAASPLGWSKPQASPQKKGAHPLPPWPQKGDPPPMITKGYLLCALSFYQGQVKVQKIAQKSFTKPRALSPRFRGRYAINLYSYQEHLDVLRFDFPLVGGTDKYADPLTRQLGQGVKTRIQVKIPFDERVTRIEIHDTVTNNKTPVDLRGLKRARPSLPAQKLRTGTFRPRP